MWLVIQYKRCASFAIQPGLNPHPLYLHPFKGYQYTPACQLHEERATKHYETSLCVWCIFPLYLIHVNEHTHVLWTHTMCVVVHSIVFFFNLKLPLVFSLPLRIREKEREREMESGLLLCWSIIRVASLAGSASTKSSNLDDMQYTYSLSANTGTGRAQGCLILSSMCFWVLFHLIRVLQNCRLDFHSIQKDRLQAWEANTFILHSIIMSLELK